MRGQRAVEVEHQHRIGPGRGEQLLALVERGQAERRRIGAEMAHRMRIERRDDRRAAFGRAPSRTASPTTAWWPRWKPSKLPSARIAPRRASGIGFAVVEANHGAAYRSRSQRHESDRRAGRPSAAMFLARRLRASSAPSGGMKVSPSVVGVDFGQFDPVGDAAGTAR